VGLSVGLAHLLGAVGFCRDHVEWIFCSSYTNIFIYLVLLYFIVVQSFVLFGSLVASKNALPETAVMTVRV